MDITPIRDNVDLVRLGDRQIYLVGTAHVSQASADLAEEVIREVNPDSVAVELCESRYSSLRDPDRWKNTDIFSVIRQGKAYVLMVQLMLAGFQKRLGNQLQIKPGAEMLRAVEIAEELQATTVLADRDIRTTLKRTWASLGLWSMMKLLFAMVAGLFSSEKIEADEIERLKNNDALEELMREFSEALPGVRSALIDERDQYLSAKIKAAPGETVVAVIGAGHIPGIRKWIFEDLDLEHLEEIPPPSGWKRMLAWMIPGLVLGLMVYGFFASGVTTGFDMMASWFWINSSLAGLGALCAGAHPLTILTAFVVAPFTSLHPLVAAGWLAGLVEAAIRKPRVSDLENIADEISTFRGLWRNRVSRILLVVALTNLFGTAGTLLGIKAVASLL